MRGSATRRCRRRSSALRAYVTICRLAYARAATARWWRQTSPEYAMMGAAKSLEDSWLQPERHIMRDEDSSGASLRDVVDRCRRSETNARERLRAALRCPLLRHIRAPNERAWWDVNVNAPRASAAATIYVIRWIGRSLHARPHHVHVSPPATLQPSPIYTPDPVRVHRVLQAAAQPGRAYSSAVGKPTDNSHWHTAAIVIVIAIIDVIPIIHYIYYTLLPLLIFHTLLF